MFISNTTKKAMVLPVALFLASASFAQTPLTTPAELKAACETSPGNIITLSQSAKISVPIYSSLATQVNCGCTIILANASTLDFERANVQFAGAFTVQSSGGKGEAKFTGSSVKADAISINLGGEGSALQASQSAIQSTAGNTTIVFGSQAKMELYGTIRPSVLEGFTSTGVLSVNAGSRFTGSIVDMAFHGNGGVSIQTTGNETLLKIEKTGLRAVNGAITIEATGDKSKMEVAEAGFYPNTSTTINFSGAEAGIKLNEIRFAGPFTNTQSLDGVTIMAANGIGKGGKIEMSEISAYVAGGFLATSGLNGEAGGVKLEKSVFTTGGNIHFETGFKGSTEVKENTLNSATRLTVRTGAQGNCTAVLNRSTAPIIEACTPAPIALMANRGGASSAITVYPNPATKGTVNLNLDGTSGVNDVFITDMNGRMVKQWKAFEGNALTINELNNGIYNLQLVNSATGDKTSKRFVITD